MIANKEDQIRKNVPYDPHLIQTIKRIKKNYYNRDKRSWIFAFLVHKRDEIVNLSYKNGIRVNENCFEQKTGIITSRPVAPAVGH